MQEAPAKYPHSRHVADAQSTIMLLNDRAEILQVIHAYQDSYNRRDLKQLLQLWPNCPVEKTLSHEGNAVRAFYAALEGPVVVGIEATGSMQWFLELLQELGIQCRVGHPAKIRAKETRKQKHDRRDARLILELLIEDRFPEIWMPSIEERDLRTLLRDRHQWVKMRARLQHALRRGHALWSQAGQSTLQALPLPPYTSQRRTELLNLYEQLQQRIQELAKEVEAHRRGNATIKSGCD
jgi:transposase